MGLEVDSLSLASNSRSGHKDCLMQAVLPVAAAVGCLHAWSLGAMNTSAWCYNCSLILVSGLSHHPETRESKSSYSTFIKTTEVQGCP